MQNQTTKFLQLIVYHLFVLGQFVYSFSSFNLLGNLTGVILEEKNLFGQASDVFLGKLYIIAKLTQ